MITRFFIGFAWTALIAFLAFVFVDLFDLLGAPSLYPIEASLKASLILAVLGGLFSVFMK